MSIDPCIEAHKRYQGYRDAAFHLTWECMSQRVDGADLRVLPIDANALAFWDQIVRHFGAVHSDGGFPWPDIYQQIRTTPRRFDIAIWAGPILCGMAAGKASRGNENVTIRWMERFELPVTPLRGRVALTVLTAADHFAKIISRQYVMIKNPLPQACPLYESWGFSLAPKRPGATYSTYYRRPVA